MFARCAGFCFAFAVLLPVCTRTFWYFLSIFPFFFFPILSVWQVWEGCVLPRCSGVVHWVWECIGEKCSGIQVPVPYVFRNCGINQVSTVGHIQNSNGWGRGLEIRASTFYWCSATNCWPPVLTDHLPLCRSYWSLKYVPAGWDPLFPSSWCFNNL